MFAATMPTNDGTGVDICNWHVSPSSYADLDSKPRVVDNGNLQQKKDIVTMIEFELKTDLGGYLFCKAPNAADGEHKVTDADAVRIFEKLREDTTFFRARLSLPAAVPMNLMTISLPSHCLGDKAVRALVQALVTGTAHVQTLELYRNRLGDAAAQALSQLLLLAPAPGVHSLSLSHNFFSPAGVSMLLAAAASSGRYPMKRDGHWVPLWLRVECQLISWPQLNVVTHSKRSYWPAYQKARELLDMKEQTLLPRCKSNGRWPESEMVNFPHDQQLLCMPIGKKDWPEDSDALPQKKRCCAKKFCQHATEYGPIAHLPYFWSQRGILDHAPQEAQLAVGDESWRTWAPRVPISVRMALQTQSEALLEGRRTLPDSGLSFLDDIQADGAQAGSTQADTQDTQSSVVLPVRKAVAALASTADDEKVEDERHRKRLAAASAAKEQDDDADAWPDIEIAVVDLPSAKQARLASKPVAPAKKSSKPAAPQEECKSLLAEGSKGTRSSPSQLAKGVASPQQQPTAAASPQQQATAVAQGAVRKKKKTSASTSLWEMAAAAAEEAIAADKAAKAEAMAADKAAKAEAIAADKAAKDESKKQQAASPEAYASAKTSTAGTSAKAKYCPMLHPLRVSVLADDGGCDVCSRPAKKGDIMHRCKACNYDECESCFNKAEIPKAETADAPVTAKAKAKAKTKSSAKAKQGAKRPPAETAAAPASADGMTFAKRLRTDTSIATAAAPLDLDGSESD